MGVYRTVASSGICFFYPLGRYGAVTVHDGLFYRAFAQNKSTAAATGKKKSKV